MDGAITQREQGASRSVTGPLPSWGGTAKSLEGRTRNIIGWAVGAFVVVAIGLTLSRRESETSAPPTGAVLITPPATEPSPVAKELPTQDPLVGPPVSSGTSVETTVPPSSAEDALPSQPTVRPASRPVAAVADPESNPYGAAPAPTPTPLSPTCVLNLNSLPPAKVLLDGIPLGFTPKIGITVETGEHRVLFYWEDGVKRASVTCAKGETKTVAVRLYDPRPADDLPAQNPYR